MILKHFREKLKDYFTFTKRERSAIISLLFILGAIQVAIIYTHFYKQPDQPLNSGKFEKELIAFEEAVAKSNMKNPTAYEPVKQNTVTTIEPNAVYFYFDPNTIPDEKWLKLGLTERTVKIIRNYLNKGGQFRTKEDLKKIYHISEADYKKLEPYIKIEPIITDGNKPKSENKPTNERTGTFNKNIPKVELNSAALDELIQLPLIGEKRALQLIKYRDLLGGYVAKEQIREVYAINDTVYDAVKDHIYVVAEKIKRININTADTTALRHPYIKRSIARVIINYRIQHGSFKTMEEFRKIPLSDSLFKKLIPYVTLE